MWGVKNAVKMKKMFVPFLVDVLTDKHVSRCVSFSIDMNVLTDKCGLRRFTFGETASLSSR